MTHSHEIFVSVGSNAPDAKDKVQEALKFLCYFMQDVKLSSVYTTPAINGDGSMYHNAVASGIIDMTIEKASEIFKEWETECGRVRESGYEGCVTIDLDIVIADGEVLRQKDFSREYFQQGFRELVGNL